MLTRKNDTTVFGILAVTNNLYIGGTLCAAILILYYMNGKRYSFFGQNPILGLKLLPNLAGLLRHYSGNYAEIRYRACNCW